jgi:hypothetical protein
MPFQISPAINVSEIDLTTVVPAISTTEAGIAAHLSWGPAEKRVLVTSEDVLAQNFGKPNSNTATDFFTAANFLAYGNQLWTVRTIETELSGGTGGASGTTARNATLNAANTVDTLIKNEDDYEDNYSSGISNVGAFVAKYAGELGNSIKVSTCPSANAWSSTLTGTANTTNNSATIGGTATLFTTEVSVGDILLLGPDKEQRKVLSIANSSTLTLDSVYSGNTSTGLTVERRWEYYNFFDVAPSTSTYTETAGGSNDEMHIAVVDEDGAFTNVAGQVLERFEKVSMASDAKTEDGATNYYKNVINQQSSYLWWAAHVAGLTNAGNKAVGTTFGTTGQPISGSMVNGRDGDTPSNSAYIEAYNKFRSTEDVDTSFLLASDQNQTVITHLINNISEVRKDCLTCFSPERADVVNNSGFNGSEMEDIIAFRNSLPSSSYAVMDSGWKYMYDKYNDLYRHVPLNGDTAGLMVRTDLARDPWWSPAGFNRGNIKNVIRLSYNPSQKAQRDQLYKNGINPVVTFPGQGTVLFGDKTLLAKPSAFDRINVRRLFIVLEKAISTAAKFTLFEFNDDFTRAQFVSLVEPFLRDVQGRRGITDFRVVCDSSNNTGEVIDRNEFIGDIYIKPNRSINFIQLNFVAVRTGVEFEEVVGQF